MMKRLFQRNLFSPQIDHVDNAGAPASRLPQRQSGKKSFGPSAVRAGRCKTPVQGDCGPPRGGSPFPQGPGPGTTPTTEGQDQGHGQGPCQGQPKGKAKPKDLDPNANTQPVRTTEEVNSPQGDQPQGERVPPQGQDECGPEPPLLHGHLSTGSKDTKDAAANTDRTNCIQDNSSLFGPQGVNIQPQDPSVFGPQGVNISGQDPRLIGVWCDLCNRRLIELKRQALKLWMPFASHKTPTTIKVSNLFCVFFTIFLVSFVILFLRISVSCSRH